tara:strand:+ start:1630 stop:2715 length:1086 start_codon:yes stop_codon:yes gene_type:complete
MQENTNGQYLSEENPSAFDPSQFTETPEYRGEAPAQESQPAQEPPREVLQNLEQRGYDVSDYNNDEEFIAETEARFAAAQQAEAEARAQAQYAQQMQASQHPYQQPPEQPPEEEATESKPEFDQNWTNLVEPDEYGRYVIREEYAGSVDPSIADKVNEYVAWRQDRSNAIIEDPVNTILEAGLGDQINAAVNNAVSQALHQTSQRDQASQFIQQHAKDLYVQNAQGEFERDGNGQPILSPVGKALNDAHVMLRNQGMYEPQARHQVAMQMVQNHFTQRQLSQIMQQQPQQPQQTAADYYKQQYTDQPFAQPTNPLPPGYMPNTPVQPTANALGANGLPEHNSLGSLATALAVHKGFLQPKG